MEGQEDDTGDLQVQRDPENHMEGQEDDTGDLQVQ